MNEIQNNPLIIYTTKEGEIDVTVQIKDETLWLSLNQMSEVFERDKSVISRHIKNIFAEGELDEKAVVAFFATVQVEGERQVERRIEYYNLDMIISVGYRVNSKRGTEFRKWASKVLKEYLIEGYSVNRRQINTQNLNRLKQTIELLSTTLVNQNLVDERGSELLDLITAYAKTWDMLVKYDEDNLTVPNDLEEAGGGLLDYTEALKAINTLKRKLGQENSSLFGAERDGGLEAILGNIDQTWGGEFLYKSHRSKAAHLLYFIIKDHPFSDGNKRIGSLLFLLYLSKTKIGLKNMGASGMTSLALLVAESSPAQKDLTISLIMNLIGD